MKLSDLLNESSNSIDEQIKALENSIRSYHGNLESAIEAGKQMVEGDDSKSDEFYKAAQTIVEPIFDDEEAEEDYVNQMENDPDNWVGFISNTFGSDWGEVAKIVSEYGY